MCMCVCAHVCIFFKKYTQREPINVIYTPQSFWSKFKQEIKLGHCYLLVRAKVTIPVILQNTLEETEGLTGVDNLPKQSKKLCIINIQGMQKGCETQSKFFHPLAMPLL